MYPSAYTKHIFQKWCLFISLLLMGVTVCPISVFAQHAMATVDRKKILLGEQITLNLKLENVPTSTTAINQWFAINDTFNHLQVSVRKPIDTVEVNGTTSYLQQIAITSFDSGQWVLPALSVSLVQKNNGSIQTLQTDSILIDVLPVNVDSLLNYHDIKEIIDVPVQPDYLLYATIAAAIILLALVVWWLYKKYGRKKITAAKAAPVHALEQALGQLYALQQQLPIQQGHADFYTALTSICRQYIMLQLGIKSQQATSDELMVLLGVYLQPQPQRTAFYQLLRLADIVKFAKYIPADEQQQTSITTAIHTIQYLDNIKKQIPQHA